MSPICGIYVDFVREWSRLFCPAMDWQKSLHFDKSNVKKTDMFTRE